MNNGYLKYLLNTLWLNYYKKGLSNYLNQRQGFLYLDYAQSLILPLTNNLYDSDLENFWTQTS